MSFLEMLIEEEEQIIHLLSRNIGMSIQKVDILNHGMVAFVETNHHVTGLSLNETGITYLPNYVSNLKYLQELMLYDNSLSSLADSFTKLRQLKKLYLAYNSFTVFPSVLCSLSALEILYLQQNKIKIFQDVSNR